MSTMSFLIAVSHILPALVADKVAQNEALYRDIDVTHKYEYRLVGKDPGELRTLDGQLSFRTVQEAVGTAHIVMQKGMYRIEVAISTTAGKENTTRSIASAFDGEKSIIREGKRVDKFDGPKPMPREGYFPHLWATAPSYESFPLSAIVAGGDRWKKAGDRTSIFKNRKLTSRVVDFSATLGKERCVIVRCELARPMRSEASSAWVYWLAVDKNYLPIKTEAYEFYYSKKLPIESTECGDFRELRKGVWLPYRLTKTVFDERELRNGKHVVSNMTKTSITSAKLGPDFGKSYFQDVQMKK